MRRYFICSFIIVLITHLTAFTQAFTSGSAPYASRQIDSLIDKAYPLVKKDVSKAMILFSDIELLSLKANYTKGLAEGYLAQAEIFSQRGYSKRALDLYDLSLQLSRKNNDLYNIAIAEEHISVVHRRNRDLKEADCSLRDALAIFKKLGKQRDEIDAELRYGLIKIEEKKFDEAAAIYNNTLALSKKTNYQFGEKKTYYNRGFLYNALNKPDSAIYYFHNCLKIDTLTNDTYGKALSLYQLSLIYLKANKPAQAVYYAEEVQKYAGQVKALDLLNSSAQILLTASLKSNNPTTIIKWQNKLLEVDKQIQAQDKNDAIAFIEILKQEQQKQLLAQKEVARIQKVSQVKSFFILGCFIVLVVALIFWIPLNYNYKRAHKYALQLQEKNKQIEKHVADVEMLNEQVTAQNTKLEGDNKLKDKLLSVISHDLRHPLANTKSILDLVNMKLVSFEEADHLFAQLEAQYIRSITLLDNLLFWIKGQMEGVESRKSIVQIYQLIEVLADEQKMSLIKKDIRVLNQIDPSIGWLAEKESVKIIFRNLLGNAVKFTNKKGQITFSSAISSDGRAVIKVKDNGVGMSAETLEKINKEIHYTSRGTANEEGSGLGLMLIRDLIRKYDGALHVNSKPGEGSEFTVTFTIAVSEIKEMATA